MALARAHAASLVVLDGFRGMRRLLTDGREAPDFLYSLGAKLGMLGSTTLVVVEGDATRSEPTGRAVAAVLERWGRLDAAMTFERELLVEQDVGPAGIEPVDVVVP